MTSETPPSEWAMAVARNAYEWYWKEYALNESAAVLSDEQIIEHIARLIESRCPVKQAPVKETP